MGRLSARTAPEPFATRTSRRRVNRFLSEEPVLGTINDAFASAQRREQRIFCTTLSLVEKPSPRRCLLPVVSVGSPSFRAEHHGFLERPQQSVGNQADDSRWHNNLPGTMEDFVEVLDDSDCSNLSTTQENDPDAYEGLQQLQGCDGLSMSSVSGHRQPDKPVPDTGKSYTDNDTGHINLDFSPQPLFSQAPGDEIGNGQLPTKSGMPDIPQEDSGIPRTPAQPRFVPERPGTLLRASQMFRETQPSPASCGRQGIGSSSDRPTPGLYNNLRLQSYELSPLVSPLNRRSEKVQPARLATVEASSPLQPSKSSIVNKSYPQLSQILPRVQHRTSLYDTYESRKESQERRMRLAGANDGSQSSDDAFSDSDAEISRRARRAKEAAAREIAVASVSIPHPNPKSDEVEVPSTNNRRRRSRSESCTPQGSGEVSRSAQENTTIVDSQVVPAVTVAEEDCCLALESNEPAAYSPNSACDDASSSPPKHSTRPNALLRFGQDDSEAMENGPEVCDTSARRLVRRLSTETCNKESYVYSPAEYKVRSPQDRIGLVPETSPLGPHQYGLAIFDSNDAPEIAVQDLAEIEIHTIKNDAFDEATKSQALRPRSQRQIFALPEQGQKPSKAESGSNEMLKLRHSPVNSISTTKESPPTAKAQNMTSTSPVLEEISDGKTALKSIPSSASSLSAKKKDRTQAITDGNLPETGAGHKRMRSASKLRSPLKSLRRAVGEGENTANKTVVEDNAPFCSEVRADVDSRSDPAATNRLENPSEGHILSLEMIDGSNTATVAGGSSGITSSSDAVTRTHEQSQKSFKLSKGIRNTSETSRRLTRKNRAQSNRTPNNALLTSSTYKPVTRSSRQTSVTSEKSKTAELEDRDVPTIWGRKKSLSSRSTTGDLDIFRNMAFSVSYIKRVDEKKRVVKLIKQHGGQLLENGFDELFDFSSEVTTLATSPERNDSRPINLTLTAGARNIGFVCLIADEHSRKAKYMQALALDLPCISGKWIEHCVTKGQILDWDSYLLAAGESSFLGGAVHNRNLKPYSALTSKFARHFEERKKLLEKKSVLLIMGKGRAEERKRAYLFLTRALGADRVERVHNNQEARKVLLASETRGELWGLVYVDEKEEVAEEAIFGADPPRKRKRSSLDMNESDCPVPKKVRIISDEFVIQSLILGKLLEGG